MTQRSVGAALALLTVIVAGGGAAASFLVLYDLRDDPMPGLASLFRIDAFLQFLPFALAAILAIALRNRPAILAFTFAATLACGLYGWWWLSEMAEARRFEYQPVRRRALGNLLPDIEGQTGSVKALVWPFVELGAIGIVTLVGWAAVGGRGVPTEGAKNRPGP
jgi:hypothetical protein